MVNKTRGGGGDEQQQELVKAISLSILVSFKSIRSSIRSEMSDCIFECSLYLETGPVLFSEGDTNDSPYFLVDVDGDQDKDDNHYEGKSLILVFMTTNIIIMIRFTMRHRRRRA